MIDKKTLLVTGSNGFVGKNILPMFSEDTRGFDNIVTVGGKAQVDLTDPKSSEELFKGGDVHTVLNLCGRVGGLPDNVKHPGQFFYQNTITAINQIESFRKYSAGLNGNFIQLGTICSYPKNASTPYKECDLLNGEPEPTNAAYAYSKRAQLNMLEAYRKEYGINYSYLIVGNIFGAHDHFNDTTAHIIPATFNKFLDAERNGDKKITVFGTGKAERDFYYIGDLCKVIHELVDHSTNGPVNISSGNPTSIIEVVHMIRDVLGLHHIGIETDTSRPDGQAVRCLDTEKIESITDFKATPLEEGLRLTKDFLMKEVYA